MSDDAVKILTIKSLFISMSKNAKEYAKKYDLKKILPLYEEAYQEALNQ